MRLGFPLRCSSRGGGRVPIRDVLRHVLTQVHCAKDELDGYAPDQCDWFGRANRTCRELIPWLAEHSGALRSFAEDVLNSPDALRTEWERLRRLITDAQAVARIDKHLGDEAILLDFIAGDTVSIVVTRYLLEHYPLHGLGANSKSDYPDLFLLDRDYSALPKRSQRGEGAIGAAVRGQERKPVRVPDGLEIKTSRNGAPIDCHYPHRGLHLLLSFNTRSSRLEVDDVLVAFLRQADYRISNRRTEATTVKASFNRAPFVSILRTHE